ncbi:MAG: hypothetical protein MJ189_01270 [Coriobacteriales bacterium]|nr:hypothetical protein [Coriobacteriales bacterium]
MSKNKEKQEEAQMQAFLERKAKDRKQLIKRVLIIVVCGLLIIGFCIPSFALLLN